MRRFKTHLEDAGDMQSLPLASILDLMPTRRAVGND
jgi:hypothetical protein